MQHVTLITGRSWSIVQQALISSILFAFMMATELFICTSSPLAAGRYFPKRYTLRGDIGLIYEKKWTTQTDVDISRFTHSYHLGLSGFALDPRLMTFDVDTTFSQENNNPGDNIDSYGFDTSLSFLNKPARRGFFSHFPRPINLTFSTYKTGNSRSQNYGISLGYDPFERWRVHRRFQQQQQQQQLRRQQQMNQPSEESDGQPPVENGGQQKQGSIQRQINSQVQARKFPFPLPVIYVDYDKNYYSFNNSSDNFNVDTDYLTLRLIDRDVKTEYLAEYDYQKYKGIADITTQFLNIEVNYRNYWEQDNTKFDSYNRAYLTDIGDSRTLQLSNRNLWDKRLGSDLRDNVALSGGGSYFKSDQESTPSNYDLNARAQYNKNYSKLWNRASADLLFGDSGEDTIYLVRLFNEANYDLSKRLSLRGRFAVGRNELGEEYGAGANLWIRTFINLLPGYDYSTVAASEGRTNTHSFSFDMNGIIYRSVTFNSRNSYSIREVSGSNPFKEKVLDLRGDVFWFIRLLNINIGASHIKVSRNDSGLLEGETPVDVKVTSLYSNISAPLFKNAFLTMNTTYTKDLMQKTLSFRPTINWNIRQVNLTAEYELRNTSGERDVTDHRIFFRLVRTFSKGLRRFW